MKLKALILDDDLVDQKLIIRALKNSNFDLEYTTVDNPTDFFENHNLKDFNIFFIDYLLPEMDGVEVIKKIRALGCKGPIILNTSQEDDELIERAIEAGATNYMTKDLISPSGLKSIIKSSISLNNSKKEFDNLLLRQVSIIKGTNIGTFEFDIKSGEAVINDRWCEIVGYSQEELQPINIETWIKLVHPDDLAESTDKFMKCLKKESEYYDFEFRMKHKNGTWIWVHDRGKIIDWDGDVALKMYGTHSDITERIEQTNKILKLKELLEQTNAAAIIGSWEYDFELGKVKLSKILATIFGEEKEMHVSSSYLINKIKDTYKKTKIIEAFKSLRIEPGEIQFDFQLNFDDNTFKWVKLIGVHDSVGKFYGSIQDITQQKFIENELVVAKKDLELAMQAKDAFLANMSHEIRTPMNAIIGFTEILSKFDYSNEQKEYLEAVRYSGENLLGLINDILDFSKIESGKLEIEKEPFILSEVIQNVLKLMSIKANKKNIKLNLDFDENVPEFVVGDATRLNQILINLIGNAIKFTEKGEVLLKVHLITLGENQVKLFFEVKDSGIGIPADKLEHIFQRFTQAESSTTRNFGGTGLGLSICKSLVELQGSELIVASEQGVGSCFSFELNYGISKENLKSKKNSLEDFCFEENDLKILVFEDNLMNQKLIYKVLKDFGLKDITIASDGPEGLELVKNSKFGLIFMDIQMPTMTGYVATKEIRNLIGEETPIIGMTAQAFKDERKKCLDFGMNDYLSKPFKQFELFDKISEITGLKSQKKEIKKEVLEEKELETLDLTQLYNLSGGDKEFETDLLSTFVEQTTEELLIFNKSFELNETKNLIRIAHKMKSSIQLFENKKVMIALNEIELMKSDPSDLKDEIKCVQNYFENKIRLIIEYLKK